MFARKVNISSNEMRNTNYLFTKKNSWHEGDEPTWTTWFLQLSFLTERRNILQLQIDLQKFLAGNVIPADAWFATSSSCYKWRVELVDDSDGVVIMSSQAVTQPANTTLSDGVKDVRLAGPPAKLLIGHKIESEHTLDDPGGVGLNAMDAEGNSFAERPLLGDVEYSST